MSSVIRVRSAVMEKTPLRNGMCCKPRFHGFAKEHGKKQSARELQKRMLEGIYTVGVSPITAQRLRCVLGMLSS
jgi:hypothetical protein